MPELPEVETTVLELRGRLVGRTMVRVEVVWPGCVARPSVPELSGRLAGQVCLAAERRAKYIILTLQSQDRLVIHMRMSGQVLIDPLERDSDKHTRLLVTLDDHSQLRFVDQRKFGRVALVSAEEFAAGQPFPALGPEPLDEAFTPAVLAQRLAGRHGPLKPLLLDQSFVAGLGNIYADESLALSCLSPLRRADSLAEADIARLHAAIQQVLRVAVQSKGTSFQSYRTTWGLQGLNQTNLRVFRRAGEPCQTCGTAIERIRLGGRATHFCPSCQR